MGRPPKTNLPNELTQLLKKVGSNLSAIRKEKGLTQSELARRSKVSITTINEIETRRIFRDIRLSTLTALSSALGVPATRFFWSSDLELHQRDQAQLLKASEAISRIAQKIRDEN